MPSQAGLFSAALTSFVVDSKQNLQANPTDKMVYYLEQHSTILSQISQQIASIAPQVSIPSTPPPPFPAFSPSLSDIRINAFWFMALTFSLSAALLAILVQQCVRDYMHVFQRYSDPQKSSRMRQYLYEGSEGWYLPVVAEAVPGLLHVSLFLFFVGLADSTLNINTTIGLSTTIPIGICGLLYLFITLAPVIYPQSPYQTSYSGIFWYAIQKLRGRSYKDRNGESKPVSTNMAQGQMQLSMEGTMDREGRDKRAILWLMDNLTEATEIQSFVTLMPGSLEAWTEVSKEDVKPPVFESSLLLRTIRNTHERINRLSRKTWDVVCMIPEWIFCIPCFIPAVLCLIPSALYAIYQFCYNYYQRISFFIHRQFKTSPAGFSSTNAMVSQLASRRPFVATSDHERNTIREFCWRVGHFFDTCKNPALFANDELRQMRVRACVEVMASLVSFADVELGWFGDNLQALADIGSVVGMRNLSLAGKDQAFVAHWTCLSIMAIRPTLKVNLLTRQISNTETFRLIFYLVYGYRVPEAQEIDETLEHQWKTDREGGLSSKISFAADIMREFNYIINSNFVEFDDVGQIITRELPGVDFDFPDSEPFLRQSLELFRDPAKLRFMSCRQPLKFFEYLERVDGYRDESPNSDYELKQVIEKIFWPKHLLQRMLSSIEDLRWGGGLGFAVELFLLSLKQLLSTYPSQQSYSTLYIGTFKAITSDRRKYNLNVGTLQIVLDAVASDQGFLRTFDYPDYIADEVWELLGDILEGLETQPETSSNLDMTLKVHVDSALQRLTDLQHEDGGKYEAKASAVIHRVRALSTFEEIESTFEETAPTSEEIAPTTVL